MSPTKVESVIKYFTGDSEVKVRWYHEKASSLLSDLFLMVMTSFFYGKIMETHRQLSKHIESQETEPYVSKRLVVKIGTSTITGGRENLDTKFMDSIATQLSILYTNGIQPYLVTSGAVGCGKVLMSNYDGSRKKKQIAAALGQPILIEQWKQQFNKYGINIYQVLVTERDVEYAQQLLADMIDGIPIINANDTVNPFEIMQLEKSADNDELTKHIALAVQADTVLLLSDRSVENKFGCPMQTIYPDSYYGYELEFYGSNKVGTGGMQSKHNVALSLAQQGIRSIIGNGREENIILNAAKGKLVGTTYLPPDSS
ncbi:hypothetical protein KAZ66_01205 [Candidatus Woesebacteria bacterium]|nr:hypothetical protein [Candidatus Woesebacteria bacterium]